MTTNVIKDAYRTHFKVVGVALDRDGLAAAQALTASTAMTLAGALTSGGTFTAGDGSNCRVGKLIGVYSGDNISTVVFTIVGTDPDGLALSETVTGVNASTVFTTKYFYTVTSVTPSDTSASLVEVGQGTTFATQRIPVSHHTQNGFTMAIGVEATGTFSVTAQHTMTDLMDESVTPTYIADTSFATKTATYFQTQAILVTATRFIAVSYTGTPTFYFHAIQAR